MHGSKEDKQLLEECKKILQGTPLEKKIDKYLTKYNPDFEKHLVDFLKADKNIDLKPEQLSSKLSVHLKEYKEKRKRKPR